MNTVVWEGEREGQKVDPRCQLALCLCWPAQGRGGLLQGSGTPVQRAHSFIQKASLQDPYMPSLWQGPGGGGDKLSETWAHAGDLRHQQLWSRLAV